MSDPEPTPARCRDCHRLLTDSASIARHRGPVCAAKFDGDTHISRPPVRRARRRRLPEDVPFPDFLDLAVAS